MKSARVPARARRARAAAAVRRPEAVPTGLILLFILAICLALACCQTEEIVKPPDDDGDGIPDEPVCGEGVSALIVVPPADCAGPYPAAVRFECEPHGEEPIDSLRCLLVELAPGEDGIALLNEDPARFEQEWSAWRAPGPGGGAVIGSDDELVEPLEEGSIYLFAVQAMDRCGGATEEFSADVNARQFLVHTFFPVLTIFEPLLGVCSFHGTGQWPAAIPVPPLVSFLFQWRAEQTYPWFGPIEYRFGWDLQDLGNPGDWYCHWSPRAVSFGQRGFYSGVHAFYVEARDDAGSITRARIEIEVIPFPMDRPVLWIDDWRLPPHPAPDGFVPGEEQHDGFWTGLCSMAPGFDPARDVLEADALYRGRPVPIEAFAHYRSVVWTYGQYDDVAWRHTVRFTPPDQVGCPPPPRPNNLRLFFAAGGAALTCGRSDGNWSALAATFAEPPEMPVDVVREISPGNESGGALSMPHDDYYVTVIDKVVAEFRDDLPDGIVRSLDRDAMRRAELMYPELDLPETLELRSEITQPGMFWYPPERGFYFVEVYNPAYWMEYRQLSRHRCFQPVYLMRSRNTLSPLDRAAVAIRTVDRDCEKNWWYPYVPGGLHFGFPLWYIEPAQSEAIARHLFERWGII